MLVYVERLSEFHMCACNTYPSACESMLTTRRHWFFLLKFHQTIVKAKAQHFLTSVSDIWCFAFQAEAIYYAHNVCCMLGSIVFSIPILEVSLFVFIPRTVFRIWFLWKESADIWKIRCVGGHSNVLLNKVTTPDIILQTQKKKRILCEKCK